MAQSSRLFFSASAAIAAAGSDDLEDDEEPGEVIQSAPPLGVGEERVINSAAGIKKKLLASGRGWESPVAGDEVTVHYTVILMNGSKLDSTKDRGEPLTFNLGSGFVSCLNEGIASMKKGEVALFTLSSSLCYEYLGDQFVPPGVDIQFVVELISWLRIMDICKDGGIVKKVLSSGIGRQTGDMDEVTVKYQVRLLDGSIVAETPEGGLEFFINQGHFCQALPRIIKTMREGEKASITVLPQYAFGGQGREAGNNFSSIPPAATLCIDICLVSLKPFVDVTGDLGVLKKIIKAGEGIRTPNDGETVHIRYTAMLEDGTVFEKLGFDGGFFEFDIEEEKVVAGLDRAVATMAKGEISEVKIKPEYGYGNHEIRRDNVIVPANSSLICEVELMDFNKEKEIWEMSGPEKIQAAEKAKLVGNDLYKNEKLRCALKKYNRAVNYVSDDWHFEGDEAQQVKILKVSCWLNIAACCLKLKDFHETIKSCSNVLNIEYSNVKAFYRRAQAYMELADIDLAKVDIQKALKLEPKNKEVKLLLSSIQHLQAESNKRDAVMYSNVFGRMKKYDNAALKKPKIGNDHEDERDSCIARVIESENSKMSDDEEASTYAQVMEYEYAGLEKEKDGHLPEFNFP